MVRIGRFPPFGKRFFRQARKLIGRCNFRHFWRVVTALAAMQGRRSLQRIEQLLGKHRTRQAMPTSSTRPCGTRRACYGRPPWTPCNACVTDPAS